MMIFVFYILECVVNWKVFMSSFCLIMSLGHFNMIPCFLFPALKMTILNVSVACLLTKRTFLSWNIVTMVSRF